MHATDTRSSSEAARNQRRGEEEREGKRKGIARGPLPQESGRGGPLKGSPAERAWRSSLATHLRRSLALSEAREALQELSSGLLRAVGLVWSSTVRSLPCFHSS